MAHWHSPLFLAIQLLKSLHRRLSTAGRMVLLLPLLLMAGCSSLFFYPDHRTYITPQQLDLKARDIKLHTSDGDTLNAWFLPARGKSRGIIYYLHGNAQNMSAHIVNVAWLPAEHYSIFMIDYRGFGKSTGEPDLAGALNDAETGLRWVFKNRHQEPVFMLGQSLGAALTLDLAGRWRQLGERPAAVVVDGAFTGFRRIARAKLDQFWLTWPFQYPLSWTIPDYAEPIDRVADISPVPLMLIASHKDEIVPFHNGVELFHAAREPKRFLATNTPHTATFLVPAYRKKVLDFLAEYGGN